jgi:hypothetical protein
MASDSTSIDDLPAPGGNNVEHKNNVVLEKKEMNNAAPPISPTDLSPDSINKIVASLQQASSNGMTQLPSSHIPMQTHQHIQDQQIQPNYVPKPPTNNNDYIKEHESIESMIQKNNSKKQDAERLDNIYNELQMPVLAMSIFFMFQLPAFRKKFQSFFPNLFLKDGNLNISGYLTKTVLFGGLFFGMNKITNYLSEV